MRIVTYNVGCSLLSPAILTWAKSAMVDVLLLQEVENEIQYPEYIERVAFEYGYYAMYVSSRTAGKSRTHGLAVLSRFPLCSSQVLELPRFNLGFHSRRRIATVAELQTPRGELRVCNIHLDSRLNIQERLHQLSSVLGHVQQYSSQMVVVGGDFNTVPLAFWKNVLPFKYVNQKKNLQEHLLAHGFTTFTDKRISTFRPRTLRWLLDGLYVRNATFQSYGVDRSLMLSDHIPLWAELVLATT